MNGFKWNFICCRLRSSSLLSCTTRILKTASAWFNSRSLKTHSFTCHKKIPFWNQLSSSVFKINNVFGLKTLNIKTWHQTAEHQHIFFSVWHIIMFHIRQHTHINKRTEVWGGWSRGWDLVWLNCCVRVYHIAAKTVHRAPKGGQSFEA